MAIDALFRLEEDDAVFVVGRDSTGRAMGFLHFAVVHQGAALSLSSMPRLRTTPNGFNEWLVCETAAWAKQHGIRRISLNFAPFAMLLAPEAKLSGLQHVERRALQALKGQLQLDNLLLFNRKFFPAGSADSSSTNDAVTCPASASQPSPPRPISRSPVETARERSRDGRVGTRAGFDRPASLGVDPGRSR